MLSVLTGIAAAVGALFVQLFVYRFLPDRPPTSEEVELTVWLILFLAAVEEAARLWAVRRVATARGALMLGRALGVGLGFVILEAGLILLTFYEGNPFSVASFAGTAIIHLLSSLVIAEVLLFLSSWPRPLSGAIALVIATLAHASYNVLAYGGHAFDSPWQMAFLAFLATATVLSAPALAIGRKSNRPR